ncbi:MAG TPA: inositol monophosphatase family protein [Burkholderiaceae bacterium]|nr:inositol monophosphatase family protein [Burkholderiaceae bacterium]
MNRAPTRHSAPLTAAEAAEFVPFLAELVAAAEARILPLFLAGTAVETKSDATPVTAADRGAEAAMRALIEARYPDHGILGEEYGTREAAARTPRYRWVLDPVDGTRAFITHCFLFGTLIALERDDGAGFRPVLGAIAHPVAGLSLVGHAGQTRLVARDGSDRAVRVRPCDDLAQATLLASTHWTQPEQRHAPGMAALAARVRLYRTWGDCFGYFALATGGADVMVDPQLGYWDVAALVPVIEGAGGRLSSLSGGNPLIELSAVATAGPLHDAVLAVLRG